MPWKNENRTHVDDEINNGKKMHGQFFSFRFLFSLPSFLRSPQRSKPMTIAICVRLFFSSFTFDCWFADLLICSLAHSLNRIYSEWLIFWMHDEMWFLCLIFPLAQLKRWEWNFFLPIQYSTMPKRQSTPFFMYIQRNVRHAESYMQKGKYILYIYIYKREKVKIWIDLLRASLCSQCVLLYWRQILAFHVAVGLAGLSVWDIFIAQMLLSHHHWGVVWWPCPWCYCC